MAIKIGTIDVAGVAVGETSIGSVAVGSNVVWQKVLPDPLCFTGNHNDMIRMVKVGSPDSANIEYSKDGNTWTAYTFGTWIAFDGADNKVYFRAASDNDTSFNSDSDNYYRFELDENYPTTVSGNLDTLLNKNGKRHVTKSRAYRELFIGMSGLNDASQLELPSDRMTLQCYYGMFQNCTALSAAPALPATTLNSSCYRNMFRGCTSLTSAPALPVTSLNEYCYTQMFYGCTSLTSAPELPATTLATGCYQSMFQGCSSLTTAPSLPATTIKASSYQSMFQGCTALTEAPVIPEPTYPVGTGSYSSMFSGCTSLSSMTVEFSTWPYSVNTFGQQQVATSNWLNGVASDGKFNCPAELSVIRGASNIPTNWEVNPIKVLCFTAEEANSTIRLDKVGSPDAISLETSTDGTTWTDYGWTDKTGDTLTLTNIGDTVYMRAKTENTTISKSTESYYKFVGSGKFGASKNIQSLLKADCTRTDAPTYCYVSMFRDCTSLTTPPELPATTIAASCYKNMFNGCSSLTSVPTLPSTTLANYCYQGMFQGCSSLTDAPALPATTLATGCYQSMFQGCSNLNTITLGYTGNFADAPSWAFNNWVNGVAASGTFYYNGSDTTTGNNAIPTGWTITPFS